jgi:hypothetical protein
MESGKVFVINYIRQGGEQVTPPGPLSPKHSEDELVTTTMQQDKTPRTKTRRQKKAKQLSPEIVAAEFVPVDTLIKESPEAKQSRKRKGSQDPEIPSKPNRKTRLTNQLRLNSKEIFNPSLKDQQPIVIEDEDTEEDISGFSNMEEMAIHTLKG